MIAPIGATALNAALAADRGIAAGLTLMFRLLGMTIGISALTAIGVWRLQRLTDQLESVVRQPDETTAAFLLRQTLFIEERVLPLAIQVVRETFLIAALLALMTLVPVMFLSRTEA